MKRPCENSCVYRLPVKILACSVAGKCFFNTVFEFSLPIWAAEAAAQDPDQKSPVAGAFHGP
jgi:hypothetical protein